MSAAAVTLPGGRRGQALALALTVTVAVLAWLGGVAPLLDWYAARGEHLAEQLALAARMQGVAAGIPALQRQAVQVDATAPAARAVLDGTTDAIAGAGLQGAVQDMAAAAGATLSSAELLPAEAVGGYRRIALRVTVAGNWVVLMALLRAVTQATPRMLVDDLALRPTVTLGQTGSARMEAGFTVIAFRRGEAPAR